MTWIFVRALLAFVCAWCATGVAMLLPAPRAPFKTQFLFGLAVFGVAWITFMDLWGVL